MGNEVSQEDEKLVLEATYKMSLDNPDVDKKVNMGTAPANCQPKHTRELLKTATTNNKNIDDNNGDDDEDEGNGDKTAGVNKKKKKKNSANTPENEGLEVVMSREGNDPEFHLPDVGGDSKPLPASSSKAAAAAAAAARREGGGDKAEQEQEKRRNHHHGENGAKRGGGGRRNRKDDSKEDQKKLSYYQMARIGYQELVNAIIRPPRADYKEEALGPPAFNFCGRRFTRTDFALRTKRGLNLQCSHWEPVERTSDRIPVVIYMHGNSSARVEVIPQLSYLLSLGLAVFSFDFAGSGKSDGEYVSLGFYEREDLMCVIAHLRATNVVSTIALWGRSMGAATALMHGDRDPSIACMILDSPFADLTQLAEEMVEKGREQGINVPNFVVSVAIRMIRGSVRKQANFDIKALSPVAHAEKCFIPALFVAGEHDDFINKRHSEVIHARYAGDKNLIIVDGDHNSPRPKFMFDSVSIFLQTCLQIPNSWALRVHPGMNLMAPPWFYPGVPTPGPANLPGGVRSPQRRTAISPSTAQEATAANVTQPPPTPPQPHPQPHHSSQTHPTSKNADQVDAEEMGMTLERQKEIQASLFKMLGQADDAVSTSTNNDA